MVPQRALAAYPASRTVMSQPQTVLLPSAYLAPVSHYMAMMRAQRTHIEVMDHYQKQTLRNRCWIASPNGPLALTIPVVRPEGGHVLMRDIRISDHGNWRHQHWHALLSSYRQSPFFEYYQDDLAPFYERRWQFLADFNEDLRLLMCTLMDIEPRVSMTTVYEHQPGDVQDLRQAASPYEPRPYYQMFADRQGFQPGLSIIDLLCNMGPESVFTLLPPTDTPLR